MVLALFTTACSQTRTPVALPPPPVVIAVAPVLNLSNRNDWDPVKVTDWLASEMQGFPGVVVIPVNRSAAALAARGLTAVHSADEALLLSEALGADVTIVAALTEFSPYDPPIVGLVLQWYERGTAPGGLQIDPSAASRAASYASDGGPPQRAGAESAPRYQFQRVYNGADGVVLEDVKDFARQRPGHESPFAWRVHLRSQELFIRYSCYAAFRSIQQARAGSYRSPAAAVEARS